MKRIPYLLSFGVFGIVTTEFGIIGILPPIAQYFQVSIAEAGQLVSLFALVVAASGPLMTLAASRFERKRLMLWVLLIFILSNILSALSGSFGMLLFARILPAFFLPVFFSTALVAAVNSVEKHEEAKVVSTIYGGVILASVLGIPMFTYLADLFTWQASFWAAASINGIAFTGFSIILSVMPIQEKVSYGRQLKILNKPILWLSVSTVCFLSAAAFSVYSYFAKYLEGVFAMNGKQISSMLLVFGLTGVAGNFVAGLSLSRSLMKTIVIYLISLAITFLLLRVAGASPFMQVVVIAIWGLVHGAGFVIGQVWIASTAREAPEFANSLVVSFANLGISMGAALGGLVITKVGIHQVVWLGWGLLLLSLWLVIIRRRLEKHPIDRPASQKMLS